MDSLTIGKVAKKADVNIETVRYYERRGLIPQPPQPKSGFRKYSSETISRIRFIKRSQELGFTLKEISLLLSLRVDQDANCQEVKEQAEEKLTEIKEKIKALQEMKKALTTLVVACDNNKPTGECPILEMLNSEKNEKI